MKVARRIALGAQGFTDKTPESKVDKRHFRRVLDRMTILQLDSVNALCRSHYLPFFARLGSYDRDKLDTYLYKSGEAFEYLSHEASITSQKLYPALRWRMKQSRWRSNVKLEEQVPKDYQRVLDEVKEHGPLSVKDLTNPGARTGPWWGQSEGKVALEWLYTSGRLAISNRNNMFITEYDLPERVIDPEYLNDEPLEKESAHLELVRLATQSLGIGTIKDIADYFRLRIKDVTPLLNKLTDSGTIEFVNVEGWKESAFLNTNSKRPREIKTSALLSPFDPVVWFRPRAERLFNFKYRIEIYVPEPKRTYGYYVLPYLLDDELVARVDLKADRKRGVLMAKGAYGEKGIDKSRVASELHKSLVEMAAWLGLDRIEVGEKGNLSNYL